MAWPTDTVTETRTSPWYWQAERAAARRSALGLDSPEGGAADGGEATGDAAAGRVVEAATAATTPPTGYALVSPVTITVWPEARSPVAEQVADVIATGGEALSLALTFARELFHQCPSESLPQVTDATYGPVSDAALAGLEERPRSNGPPLQFGVMIPFQLSLASVTDSRVHWNSGMETETPWGGFLHITVHPEHGNTSHIQ